MTRRQGFSFTKAALALALALAALASVWASSAAANAPGIASHTTAGSAAKIKQVKRFWTAKRMRHAIPLTANATRREVARGARSGPATSGRGAPVTIPPTPGRSNSGVATGPTPFATQIADPTVYPYRTQGKLFFRWRGSSYVCSATVVNTPTKRVIFSAGHCAVDAGTWSTNVAFVPGYHNGVRPYGTFVATKLRSPTPWVNSENFSYDMSAAVLGGAQRVANVVGSRGIAFNQPRQENFVSFGYPAAFPFSGETLWKCPSPFRGLDGGSPQTQWITCDMTGGSSGGGWIIQNQFLNGVNSYGYLNQPNRMYGPYFGDQALSLYDSVKNLAP